VEVSVGKPYGEGLGLREVSRATPAASGVARFFPNLDGENGGGRLASPEYCFLEYAAFFRYVQGKARTALRTPSKAPLNHMFIVPNPAQPFGR
jgi:hypothetical protein